MTLKAIWLDLDDTLLANDMSVFLPRYLESLSRYASARLPEDRFRPALLSATRAMMESRDLGTTNREVFWRHFHELTGLEQDPTEAFLERFYQEHFGELERFTQRVAGAGELVQHCLERGLDVVIATNPVFPRSAIVQRLCWAGLDPAHYAFRLITSYENMHATKPSTAYYREILHGSGHAPHEVLMAGNDPRADIEPAAAIGLHTFTVHLTPETAGTEDTATTSGTLLRLLERLTQPLDTWSTTSS